MNQKPSTSPEDKHEKILSLVSLMVETEKQLQELVGDEVDSILSPSGQSLLLRNAQEKLQRNEAKQSSILNSLPANVALIDGRGVILSVNDGWRKFAGENGLQDEASAVGQNYLEICERAQNGRAKEAQKVAAGIRSVLDGREKKFELEYPCHSPDKQRWFRLLVTPTGEGPERGAVVMHVDVTELKQMENEITESQLRHSLLFENILEGYAYCRAIYEQGRVVDVVFVEVNKAYETQTGLKDVVGKKISEVVPGIRETNPELFERYRRVLFSRKPERYESHVKSLDRWFSVTIYSYENDHFVGIFDNITERKRIEENLRESEERFSGAFAHAPIGMALTTPEGRWVKVNRALCRLTGYSEAELLDRSFQEITHPDDLPADLENVRRMLAGEIQTYEMEKRYIHKLGQIVHILLNVSLVRDSHGRPRHFVAQIQDITERKRVEAALRESEGKFSKIFQSSPAGIALSTINEGRYVDANEAFLKMLQLSRDELIGHTSVELGIWTGLAKRDAVIAKIKEEGAVQNLEMKIRGRDGKITDILWSADTVDIGGEKCLLGLSRDITERKRIELRFRRLVESNVQVVFFWNTRGEITDANDAFLKLTGYTCEELKAGRINWAAMTPPEYADLDRQALKEVADTGICKPFEKEFIRKDGARVPILIGAAIFEDNREEGVAFVLDLTSRKQIESRFRRLVESNAQGVFFWNTRGEIIDGNDAFLKIADYTRADLEAGSVNWAAMTPPEYADRDQRALKEIVATGTCTPYEKEWIRKDGTRVPILLGAAVFEDNREEGVMFVLDLTERKKIEAQFRQSQKMESIGKLASGVAHDFNNILAVIQMQADLLKTEAGLTAEQRNFAKGIGEAAQHGSNLTRQLLLFSRRQLIQPSELDFNETINNITNILRRTLGEQIQLQFKFSMEPLYIRADAGMLDQVLLNLAVNARDAMPEGGKIIIETSAVEFDETAAAQSAQIRPGKFICLGVTDSGSGIAPENLPRIFEPFFTTKETGKGTGLGLATVYGIVQEHKGWINVYSEQGHGTTFRIYLPRLDRLSGQKSITTTTELGPGGNETILLVEDKASLRNTVKIALTRLGYRVLDATDGVEALDVWNQHREEIHLLFTDMMLPGGINGIELAGQLLEANPKLKVIYASGYAAEVAGRDFPLKEGVNFLTKPFEMHKLAKIIRENLDAKTHE